MEADEERPLLRHPTPQDIGSPYTSDGSVDINKQPALKHCTGNWRACFLILGTEFCECLAFFGIAKNLVSYLTGVLHESNVAAARNVSAWIGTCFLTPLVGAVLADSYWGRYGTIVVFLLIYTVGMIVLTLSASLPIFHHASYPGVIQHVMVYHGLYLVALGTGGIKPCASSFGADQFDSADPVERASKSSFFNWYYFSINIGSLLSATILVWVQESVGWWLGFSIPMVFMGLSLGTFVIGSKVYRFRKPGGSPLTRVHQVVVAAVRNYDVQLPDDISLLYELPGTASAIEGSRKIEHTNQFRFFDKAAIVSDEKSSLLTNPWRLCTVTQVEELKMLLRMSSIWATLIFFFAVTAQMSSTFIEQGMVMDNHISPFTIPPASLSTFDVISVLICVPLFDTILVPIVRRFTGKERGFSELQRLGIGLVLSILAMIYAGLIETKRLDIARAEGLVHQKSAVPMSILWQAPQYFLLGAGEVFTSIGILEFFYDQSPDDMRSLCSAFGFVAVSVGSYLNSLILTIVASVTSGKETSGWIPDNLNEGHLDRFFWMMAVLSCLNLMAFVYCSMRYKCKKAC